MSWGATEFRTSRNTGRSRPASSASPHLPGHVVFSAEPNKKGCDKYSNIGFLIPPTIHYAWKACEIRSKESARGTYLAPHRVTYSYVRDIGSGVAFARARRYAKHRSESLRTGEAGDASATRRSDPSIRPESYACQTIEIIRRSAPLPAARRILESSTRSLRTQTAKSTKAVRPRVEFQHMHEIFL